MWCSKPLGLREREPPATLSTAKPAPILTTPTRAIVSVAAKNYARRTLDELEIEVINSGGLVDTTGGNGSNSRQKSSR